MKTLRHIALSAALCAAALCAQARPSILTLADAAADSTVVFPESVETDVNRMMQNWYLQNYTALDKEVDNRPDVATTDAELIERLQAIPTTIEMPFNSVVRQYIDMYTGRKRSLVESMLGMSLYYMPIFEQAIEKEGIPIELKYLPVIESAMNPDAVSRAGAVGLWQIMLPTARGLGLEINTLVDERRDPVRSSEAAARYLRELYDIYKDWSLAIAAYNCGPGAVNKAIRRAGGEEAQKDFWAIYNYLSPETRGYVPMFIAANYVMNNYDKHNISPVLPTKPLVTDTVHICERIHFDQISKVLDIPVEELRVLNPQFRADIIPGNNERHYTLILPSQQINAYLMSEEEIRDYEAEKYARRVVAEPGEEPDPQMAAIIAQEDQAELANADHNQLEDLPEPRKTQGEAVAVTRDRRGNQQQHLDTGEDQNPYKAARQNTRRTSARQEQDMADNTSSQSKWTKSSKKKTSRSSAPKAKSTTHTVASGDNLSTIARRYGTTVNEIKKANGISGSGDKLQPGDKLKIPGKKTAKGTKSKSGKKSKNSKKKRRR